MSAVFRPAFILAQSPSPSTLAAASDASIRHDTSLLLVTCAASYSSWARTQEGEACHTAGVEFESVLEVEQNGFQVRLMSGVELKHQQHVASTLLMLDEEGEPLVRMRTEAYQK